MLYRVFLASLTVFFIGMSVFAPNLAHAQGDEAFLVKGVTVDVSASSALEARKKAFAEARRKAYEQVAGSMLPASERPNLVVPDDRVIASLVKDIEIVKEKMTSRRYVGTLDVRFTPGAVKRTLTTAAGALPDGVVNSATATTAATVTQTQAPMPTAGMGEEYIYSPRNGGAVRNTVSASKPVTQARSVLVLPWYGTMGRQTLWGQGNPWRAAWEESAGLAGDKSLPILLPVGDVDDLRDYSPPQPLSRRGDIDNLLKRYHATEAVLAMAEPKDEGGAVISLYRYENGSPVPVGRFAVDASARDVLGEGVQKAAGLLKSLPASEPEAAPLPVSVSSTGMVTPVPQIAAPVGGTYHALARFSGLQEWVAMRNNLSRIPGLGVIGIRSISPSQANIEFSYGGDPASLSAAMAQAGMQLAPVSGNVPVTAGTPQYMLSMTRGY